MQQGLGLTQILQWITYLFPSLSDYVKYVGPAGMFLASVIGIFTNLLPDPGYAYPVPKVSDLETELTASGRGILRITKAARRVTLFINWVLSTRGYKWFYTFTATCSKIITRIKGGSVKSDPPKISAPTPFKIQIEPRPKTQTQHPEDEPA